MQDFFDILSKARIRYGLYFGPHKSPSYILAFLHGFISGRDGTDIGVDEKLSRFASSHGGFSDFVYEKFKENNDVVGQAMGWSTIIENLEPDPDKALEVFYKLLDEYLENQGQSK